MQDPDVVVKKKKKLNKAAWPKGAQVSLQLLCADTSGKIYILGECGAALPSHSKSYI